MANVNVKNVTELDVAGPISSADRMLVHQDGALKQASAEGVIAQVVEDEVDSRQSGVDDLAPGASPIASGDLFVAGRGGDFITFTTEQLADFAHTMMDQKLGVKVTGTSLSSTLTDPLVVPANTLSPGDVFRLEWCGTFENSSGSPGTGSLTLGAPGGASLFGVALPSLESGAGFRTLTMSVQCMFPTVGVSGSAILRTMVISSIGTGANPSLLLPESCFMNSLVIPAGVDTTQDFGLDVFAVLGANHANLSVTGLCATATLQRGVL